MLYNFEIVSKSLPSDKPALGSDFKHLIKKTPVIQR